MTPQFPNPYSQPITPETIATLLAAARAENERLNAEADRTRHLEILSSIYGKAFGVGGNGKQGKP